MHTDQLHTVEKFTRPNRDTLHYEATIIDPGAYSEPWTVAWDIPWTAGAELAEYICQENNQFLLKLKDDFGKPFFEDVPVEHLGSRSPSLESPRTAQPLARPLASSGPAASTAVPRAHAVRSASRCAAAVPRANRAAARTSKP